VPSKIFLDDPLPDNLPIVPACTECNGSFSLDEQYLGCFIECVIAGTTNSDLIVREKIKRNLRENPLLREKIEAAQKKEKGTLNWIPEMDRVRNVITKLARGHAVYELSFPQLDEPDEIFFSPLSSMSRKARGIFETAGAGEVGVWPEIGSRAFLRACGAPPFEDQAGPWVITQKHRYRYSVDQPGGVTVRMVISEYLACQVDWHFS
jgi:hypothetical protein